MVEKERQFSALQESIKMLLQNKRGGGDILVYKQVQSYLWSSEAWIINCQAVCSSYPN
jgi:hypothetical protein